MPGSRIVLHTSDDGLKKRIRRRTIWAVIGFILIALGIFGALNFNNLQGQAAHHVQESVLKDGRFYHQKAKPSYNFAAVKPVTPASLAFAYAHRRDYRAIGQVAVPQFGVCLNIYRGVGNVELNLGAGTMTPYQEMGHGNYSLAGHNMDDDRTYFSPLYTAKVRGYLGKRTTIMLTDFKNVYFYRVSESEFISRYRADLTEDKPEFLHHPVVSLFTCDATGAGRLFIRGKLTGYESLNKTSRQIKAAFVL